MKPAQQHRSWRLACAAVMLVQGGCTAIGAAPADAVPAKQGPAQGAPTAVPSVTEIALERDCSGCRSGTRVLISRDGHATFTITGKGRFGTSDSQHQGRVAVADIDALASLAWSGGFTHWEDIYEDPGLRDGSWTITRILADGVEKSVFSREDAGPDALRTLIAAIERVQAGVVFTPPVPVRQADPRR